MYPRSFCQEEDRRATTNVQNGLAFSFYRLPGLNFKIKSVKKWGKVRKKCEKVPKRSCPLVVAL